MVAGHFGFAALVKSRERTTPLWALMLATVWLDVVFVPLFLAHRETVQPVHAGYGGLIIHADYTHSDCRDAGAVGGSWGFCSCPVWAGESRW